MNKPNVLILGASDNPERYSYKAMKLLLEKDYPVALVGNKNKVVDNHPIHSAFPTLFVPDIITLYLGPANQVAWYDVIIQSGVKKVIFNPGTENRALQDLLDERLIAWEEACTLVLLNTNQFS